MHVNEVRGVDGGDHYATSAILVLAPFRFILVTGMTMLQGHLGPLPNFIVMSNFVTLLLVLRVMVINK